jgi:hypothetical protein
MSENVRCNIDLLKFENACVAKIHDVECVVIPIKRNDLYVSLDYNFKPKGVYFNVDVLARQEIGEYGDSHYIKQNLSKEFRESTDFQGDYKNKRQSVFFGNGKPLVFEKKSLEQANIPSVEVQEGNDDMPF